MKVLIGNLIFIAVLLLILTRFLSVWSGTAFPVNLISAGSMTPSLMEGDIIAWIPADINQVKVGDVIVFKSWLHWPEERHVIHRVVEIKQIFGKPAFVTKGDANNWTDQAGPHVVEPYVTEKNFVGKALSIGQQPLKIPLIGLIGIWINDGFQRLAQPTASKGSLTYLGVFTPLVIAIVLFIVSLFILPEKTRTLKEKLKLYILGSQALNLKKTLLSFFLIYILLLSVVHCFAYDSTPATLGIGEFPEKSSFELGSIVPGSTTNPRNLPVFNPSILPVKGIVLGNGELSSYVNRAVFTLNPGQNKQLSVTAYAKNTSQNGTYAGNMVVYSSPLWFFIPDELFTNIDAGNAEQTIICLDILTAGLLTTLTVALIVSVEILSHFYISWAIDRSWCHTIKLYLKKSIGQRFSQTKGKIRRTLGEKVGWIMKENLADIDTKKPIFASLIIIPLLLLLNSDLLAMCIASVTAGVVAFFISCKRRSKIVVASIIPLLLTITYVLLKTNYYLFTSKQSFIASITLGIGALALYLLILALFLIPFSLFSWYITAHLRNLNEQKDPLLILEGRCDL